MPEVGRFTTQDPVRGHGGLNLYLYAANPLMWLDPLGLSSKPCKTEKTPEDSYEKARGKVLK
ncbi:hypothetical protein I5R58_07255 [Serratia marcescens]|nr:hypothetical protein [Serratia marcescens]MBH2889191.1 hypothetical protein [Serratia marcescens]MBH3000502.1 hypothetical protein [Serratia marcescens]MBH3125782.1 hypothetical protein [Serratia marcescens]MBH3275922.1 hypothetical protein [Serratia marcescens]